MILVFSNRPGIASWAIRAATASRWSHVAAQIGPWVYEARAAYGVRMVTLCAALLDASEFAYAEVDTVDSVAEQWLCAQLGKPYDWTAVTHWFGTRDWQRPDAWYCSELMAGACARAGVKVVADESVRVWPGHIWNSPVLRRRG